MPREEALQRRAGNPEAPMWLYSCSGLAPSTDGPLLRAWEEEQYTLGLGIEKQTWGGGWEQGLV